MKRGLILDAKRFEPIIGFKRSEKVNVAAGLQRSFKAIEKPAKCQV